jgi:drug/metabolite transporter (DMT)-like permease
MKSNYVVSEWSCLNTILVKPQHTAFFSTYVGICLQQTAFKYTAAGIAQTIGATSPLFVLVYDLWLREKVSRPSLGYALVTIIGISLLFTSM